MANNSNELKQWEPVINKNRFLIPIHSDKGCVSRNDVDVMLLRLHEKSEGVVWVHPLVTKHLSGFIALYPQVCYSLDQFFGLKVF